MSLERLELLERQILKMDQMTAEAMNKYEFAVIRLPEVPGFGPDSAQQVIAEIGPTRSRSPRLVIWPPGWASVRAATSVPWHNHSSSSLKGYRAPCAGF